MLNESWTYFCAENKIALRSVDDMAIRYYRCQNCTSLQRQRRMTRSIRVLSTASLKQAAPFIFWFWTPFGLDHIEMIRSPLFFLRLWILIFILNLLRAAHNALPSLVFCFVVNNCAGPGLACETWLNLGRKREARQARGFRAIYLYPGYRWTTVREPRPACAYGNATPIQWVYKDEIREHNTEN